MSNPLTLSEYLAKPIHELKAAGKKLEGALAENGINNLAELLRFYPVRYLDRLKESSIKDLKIDEEATILCEVTGVGKPFKTKNRNLWIVKVDLEDHEGTPFEAMFFNQRWRSEQLKPEMNLAVFGKLTVGKSGSKFQMSHPVVDITGDQTRRIIPVYYLPGDGPPTHNLVKSIKETLSRSQQRGIYDPLPKSVRSRNKLISRQQALEGIHQPDSFGELQKAKTRLAFDELLCMQLELLTRKKEIEDLPSISYSPPCGKFKLAREFINKLPFSLTGAQEKTIKSIQEDLLKRAPMHRLLQGDVGSGKTISALAGILCAIESGHQAAFLVPTEVLAEQHFEVIGNLLAGLKIPDSEALGGNRTLDARVLTNRITGADRNELLSDLKAGKIDLVVGTSALIYDKVDFKSLAFVVVDEQHRFGVNQRALLKEKSGVGFVPDSLAMTATPIPRTVAMTIYGDLDVSILDELPIGRLPIKTQLLVNEQEKEEMWNHIIAEAQKGHQSYVVCPLIGDEKTPESSEADSPDQAETLFDSSPLKLDPNISVNKVFKDLSAGHLKDLNLAILHGQMSFEEKSSVMAGFKKGNIDVLISTTVIEVGIDIPNVTIMVILGAYRFGIAQLHQLRGRVGRSDIQSHCYLIADEVTERLEAVAKSTDGFELAEKDLELRKEGTILGNRQAGRSDLRAASLVKHRDLVPLAKEVAEEMLKEKDLKDMEWDLEVRFLLGQQEKTEYLMKS